MKKQPEQTAKTKKTLIDAFWNLAAAHGINKVTVSDIAKEAGFNRGTFYAYFTDIPDLLTQVEDDIIHDFQNRLSTAIEDGSFTDFNNISNKLVDIFALYNDKFFLLIGQNGDPNFRKLIQDEATKKFKEVFRSVSDTANGEYIMAYFTSAVLGLLTYWHETGRKISVLELGATIHGLATRGILGLVTKS